MSTTIETIATTATMVATTAASASNTSSSTEHIKELIKDLLTASLQPNKTVIITGLLIVLLFPIILHQFLHGNESASSSSKSSLPSILLAGPSGAGKTALLTLFEKRAGRSTASPSNADSSNDKTTATATATEPALTHTSQTPVSVELNAASWSSTADHQDRKPKKFLLIDTPGHPKLRSTALSRLLPLDPKTGRPLPPGKTQPVIKGVLFLLDASTLSPSSPDSSLSQAATYLYDVLLALQHRYSRHSKGSKHPPSIPVLVAANKLDLFTSLPPSLVKKELEAEIGRIRVSRSKALLDSGAREDAVDEKEEGDDWLGEYGSERFDFRQMLEFDIEVEVVGGSVVGGEGPGVDGWWRWVVERV
ncbi:signal recognition particle receptor beta subunit-domain-containing protein [Pseudoneurospora amorphoporcata]|uniref:Signal recognition particle receptor subunit beta n=1 Tax=Pseudoneurospora amorphoporcata TaxID=241081 RepID=A0AAN6NJV3_9PEZI|nr:signal recognition particle receptor beta subunit-domain-containing protein [Pseudoneurospora amorphoporcata]